MASGKDARRHRRRTRRGQTRRARANHRTREPPGRTNSRIVPASQYHRDKNEVAELSVLRHKEEQEMSMNTIRTKAMASAVAITAALSPAPVRAETTQAALSREAGTLSGKFSGLARVMAGKYDWKPGEGVRSVG